MKNWINKIIPKSKNEEIISDIKEKLYDVTNTASADISIGLENMIAKDSLRSGILVTVAVDLIDHTITESCKSFLNTVEGLQNKWNITYSNTMLDNISDLIKMDYQGLIDSVICNDYEKIPPSSSSELQINVLRQNIKNKVNSKIQEIKLHNKIKKDKPELRESKRATAIAVLTLIITGLGIYISMKK